MPPEDIDPNDFAINSWYNNTAPMITAFANKRAYLNNEYILFPGVDLKPRIEFIKEMVNFVKKDISSQKIMEDKLRANNIHYIFVPYSAQNLTSIKGITKIYENSPYNIYKVSL